ncbi:MAG: SDR family NAD(P)-dependent oxidoreductase [Caldilinea sp. CFX5]|nr:SDR family NAD(P)-dependent oxidoreductase [Caldilinea sp. CFX5]
METFQGKVAVITGAASGIGRALAQRAVQEGLKVVLADIEEGALRATAGALQAQGATVLSVRTNVTQAEEVAALAQRTLDAFGAVHLLFNNAGVAASGPLWTMSLQDWEWVLGVNLWGVVHGIRTFVPLLLQQGTEAHIVNTASIAGLVSTPGLGVYNVTKHGVVTLSETLYQELQQTGAPVHVSVLCPGWVNTRIHEAGRNRPAALRNQPTEMAVNQAATPVDQAMQQAIQNGMPAEEVAAQVFAAIRERRFYILTHPPFQKLVQRRMEAILTGANPDDARIA